MSFHISGLKNKVAQRISHRALSEKYIKPDLKYISKTEIKLIYGLIRSGIEPLILGFHHDLRDRLLIKSYSQIFLFIRGISFEYRWYVGPSVERVPPDERGEVLKILTREVGKREEIVSAFDIITPVFIANRLIPCQSLKSVNARGVAEPREYEVSPTLKPAVLELNIPFVHFKKSFYLLSVKL